MTYASKAQARKFHADPRLRKYAAEFDAATNFSKLPGRVPPKHYKHRSALHGMHKRRKR